MAENHCKLSLDIGSASGSLLGAKCGVIIALYVDRFGKTHVKRNMPDGYRGTVKNIILNVDRKQNRRGTRSKFEAPPG